LERLFIFHRTIILFNDHSLCRYLTIGRDGIICYYSESLKFIRKFHQEDSTNKNGNFVHDALFYKEFNKIVTAADDNCIAFHDYSTSTCDVRLSLGDQVPLSIDLFHNGENDDVSDTMMVYGTDTGLVGIINFSIEILLQQKRSLNLDQFAKAQKTCTVLKRKTHADWCLKVKYYHSLRSIISCSKDPIDSLVVTKQNLGGSKGWVSTSIPGMSLII
jgi:hypothetical protein